MNSKFLLKLNFSLTTITNSTIGSKFNDNKTSKTIYDGDPSSLYH